MEAKKIAELLEYDPTTGAFYWKVSRPCGGRGYTHPGDLAGYRDSSTGYWKIGIDRRLYYAHHLAWLLMTGRWPKRQIDHRNLNRSDNRWRNLREASKAENMRNRREQKNNTSGMRGVYIQKNGRYQTYIKVDGQRISLGVFAAFADAVAARLAAERKHYGDFRPV